MLIQSLQILYLQITDFICRFVLFSKQCRIFIIVAEFAILFAEFAIIVAKLANFDLFFNKREILVNKYNKILFQCKFCCFYVPFEQKRADF